MSALRQSTKESRKAAEERRTKQSLKRKAVDEATRAGMLPHEWLLKVSRGEPIEHRRWNIVLDKNGREKSRELVIEEYYADFPTRVDAAKAAAPFFAPKLASQTMSISTPELIAQAFADIAKNLPV